MKKVKIKKYKFQENSIPSATGITTSGTPPLFSQNTDSKIDLKKDTDGKVKDSEQLEEGGPPVEGDVTTAADYGGFQKSSEITFNKRPSKGTTTASSVNTESLLDENTLGQVEVSGEGHSIQDEVNSSELSTMLAGSKQELQEDGTDYGDTDDRAIAFSAEVNTTLDPPTTDVSTQFGVETGSISNANLNTTGQALGDTAAAVIGAPGMNRWGNTSDPNTTNLKQPTNQSEPNKTYDENRYLLDDEEGFPVNKNQYKVSNGNSKKEESMTSIVKQINELWTKLLSESSVQPQEEQVESLREEDEDISEFDKDEEGALLDDEIAEDEADLDADIEMSKEDLIQKLVDKLNELKDNPEKLDELDEGLLDEVKKMLDDAIGAEEAVGSAIDAANDEKMDELMDDEEAPEDDLMVAGSYMKLESLFSEALKIKTKKGQEKLMESLNTHVGNFYWITSKGNNKDIKDFGMATKVTKDSVTINKKTYPASSHSFIPMRGW